MIVDFAINKEAFRGRIGGICSACGNSFDQTQVLFDLL